MRGGVYGGVCMRVCFYMFVYVCMCMCVVNFSLCVGSKRKFRINNYNSDIASIYSVDKKSTRNKKNTYYTHSLLISNLSAIFTQPTQEADKYLTPLQN